MNSKSTVAGKESFKMNLEIASYLVGQLAQEAPNRKILTFSSKAVHASECARAYNGESERIAIEQASPKFAVRHV